jgi:hypothetical protein
MLTYRAEDNGLDFYPGYAVQSRIVRSKVGTKFSYRRLETHNKALNQPVKVALSLQGAKLKCLISLDVVSISYIQKQPQISDVDISAEIVNTGMFNSKSNYELWHPNDRWYITEQSLFASIVLDYAGQPTNSEKALVAPYANPKAAGVFAVPISDLDYRLYRPLTVPPDQELIELYKAQQATVESLLVRPFEEVLKGQRQWQVNVTNSSESEQFPEVSSSAADNLKETLSQALTNITPYLI